jgi:release factor glutamine methyltransferase
VTIGDWLDRAGRRLDAAGIERARFEARLLLEAVTGLDAAAQLRDHARALSAAERARLEPLLARRAARQPMAYVLGRRAFWSFELAVGRGVLVPRPETETLIEAALARFPDPAAAPRVLDLGTGSGCLLLAFLHERPNATGVGVDSSAEALAWAERNAEALGLAERARFAIADLRGLGRGATFELILANPPYVPTAEIDRLAPEVRDFEPRAALDGGPDGLEAYRVLAGVLPGLMAPGGSACIELGAGQAEAAKAIFAASGLAAAALHPDLSGIPRCLVLEASGDRLHRT